MPPAVFPHAQSQTLAEAPARCRRCGGPWRLVADGYACQTCPGHWHVGEKLTELVGRRLDYTDRWPMRVPVPSRKRAS